MKKFLSIFLAVAFVFSAMCMSVLAGDMDYPTESKAPTAGIYDVVGTHGNHANTENSLTDGVSDFRDKSLQANVKVNFQTGTAGEEIGGGTAIEERYAIDIQYWELVIDLTKIKMPDVNGDGIADYTYVWDVNKHEYVMANGTKNNTPIDDEQTPDTNNTELVFDAFRVTNHSSLPIQYTTQLDTKAVDNIIDIKINTKTEEVVERAKVGEAQLGSLHKITAKPSTTSGNWLTVINELGKDYAQGTHVIGFVTVTFNKVATTPTTPAP